MCAAISISLCSRHGNIRKFDFCGRVNVFNAGFVPAFFVYPVLGLFIVFRNAAVSFACAVIVPPPSQNIGRLMCSCLWHCAAVATACASRMVAGTEAGMMVKMGRAFHPRLHSPRLRVGARGDGTVAPLYHRALLHSRLYFRQLSGLAADMIVGVGNVLFF